MRAMAKKPTGSSTRKKEPSKNRATSVPSARKRLKAAFAALNERKIVALENAGYTMSDGWADVNEVATRLAKRGSVPRGATFYHRQDLQRAKRGEGLSLAFGSHVEGRGRERASLSIAKEIVTVLKEHGFTPKWNGTLEERIHTGPFDWS
jgi:hypothetical protein